MVCPIPYGDHNNWGNMNPENCLFSDSGKLGIRRHHPHRWIEVKFCMVGCLIYKSRERTILTRHQYHDTDTLTYEPIPIRIPIP